MKKKIYTIFGAVILLICISSTNGIKSPCDSPLVGDHSGAPGETDCSGCHISPVNPNNPELSFKIENNETKYLPGKSYKVIVSIKRKGHDKFGFVCTSLDSLNQSNGAFSLINSVTTRVFSENKRSYISHTPCSADSKDSVQWTYYWIAPSTSVGKINLYLALLVANHDHELTGDTTYTRVLSLSPENTGIKNNMELVEKSKVYPTIFTNELNLEFSNSYKNELKELFLLNLEGKIISKLSTNNSIATLHDNQNLPNGFYFVKIKHEHTIETIKIIKQ
jgi:hypothetical protein